MGYTLVRRRARLKLDFDASPISPATQSLGPRVTKTDGVTPKQRRFCEEFLKDLNATQAAIRAKYSEKTANEQGARLLANASVASFIQTLMDKRTKRVEIEADDVLGELKHLGHANIQGIFDENGCIKPVKEWPEDLARAVASIEVVEEFVKQEDIAYCAECAKVLFKEFVGVTKKVKFWDKPKALELMGRHKKLFSDNVDGDLKAVFTQINNYMRMSREELLALAKDAIKEVQGG